MTAAQTHTPRASEVKPLPRHPHLRVVRRPRVEHCATLRASALRPLVAPDATAHRLPDGTVLQLLWRPTVGGFGDGWALGVACPLCAQRSLVLRRPPGGGWACRTCQPVSHPSHRRSGNQRGKAKPSTWAMERLSDEQARCVRLLGLAQWPPPALFWSLSDLQVAERRPDAPRLSRRRRDALERRLDALESLRVAALSGWVGRLLKDQGIADTGTPIPTSWRRAAELEVAATQWAVRRQAHDHRTLRQRDAMRPEPFDVPMPHCR